MNKQIFLTSLALTVLAAGCATEPEKNVSSTDDLTTTMPSPGAGTVGEPLYFSSREDAEAALSGYNYGLKALPDGRVQAFVSGLNDSGADNPITLAQSATAVPADSAAVGADGGETPFPQIRLAEKKNGKAAIEALGDKLEAVARAYDMSAERLAEILATDSTAWIDEGGRLLYIDALPPGESDGQEATATAPAQAGSGGMSVASSTDAFALHSKPGANRLIYLDFNGHVATATAWNSGTLTAPAYDIDGNPAAFSATELSNIKQIWQRVAEDYAPFDVDVTTEEPSADKLFRTAADDGQYGTRAVITRSMPQLCNQACGGVAYVNVYSYYSASKPDRYQPAWVFLDKLGNGFPKYVAEAVSHEVGHNLNLTHDGNASTTYYSGHGSGVTGWGPIMGVGYYKSVTQWSKGEYPGANNLQDDITVIHAAGTPLRVDDYANNAAGAGPIAGDSSAVDQSGIIERSSDVDVFAFNTGGGGVQFNASPDPVSQNLDIQLKLLDAKGGTVIQASPADSLSASVAAVLNPGQYYLQIEGVGFGDLTTGYSDYGSLGRYQISGSYPKAVEAQAPTAIISALPNQGYAPLSVEFNGSGSSDRDGSITGYEWNFGDGSGVSRSATVTHSYNTPGTYTATLTVTDNSGLKNSASVSLQAQQSPVTNSMKVASTRILRRTLAGGKAQCVANVTLKYLNSTVSGAAIYGVWSGGLTAGASKTLLATSAIGFTGSTGQATITSPTFASSAKGSCAFSVNSAFKTGYLYDGGGSVTGSFSW
ncbi:PKD domain-containing protein [Methylomonas sp. EFPC3]|uniref:PKD domain-containing protein n=1 Tax=Methylomonas sp. EFPC3 TaxID=3021710 RepID=UPI002415C0B8|nr:PKD domain-containing protein [Methylomonas sp. EFPC3]WFP50857.1 PKD domain-containing protein [Methylomonas sp. EFPC3]